MTFRADQVSLDAMTDDTDLLHSYAEDGVEEAFDKLVRRNLDLVYAASLRQISDTHRAQDVAQSVFIDLARKAGSLRLSHIISPSRLQVILGKYAKENPHRFCGKHPLSTRGVARKLLLPILNFSFECFVAKYSEG